MGKVSFYFDEMMPRSPVKQLQDQGYSVVMAVDVGMTGKEDTEHLKYASDEGLVMVTFDRPFAGKTAKLVNHAGLICLSGTQQDVGYIVRTLAEFSRNYETEAAAGQVFWL